MSKELLETIYRDFQIYRTISGYIVYYASGQLYTFQLTLQGAKDTVDRYYVEKARLTPYPDEPDEKAVPAEGQILP